MSRRRRKRLLKPDERTETHAGIYPGSAIGDQTDILLKRLAESRWLLRPTGPLADELDIAVVRRHHRERSFESTFCYRPQILR